MSRPRALLVVSVVVAIAVALPATEAAPGQAPDPRPNVLLIETDDMEVDDLKVMPTVRRLAAEGTTFSNSFVGYSLCCPSRATLLTGQYSHNNGVLDNKPPDGGYEALDHTNTLPVWLQAAGYHTTHVGKYLNGYGARVPATTVPPGYSDWQGTVDPSTYRMFDYTVNDNGRLVHYGTAPAEYQTDVLADRAVRTIRERAAAGGPFYLNFSPVAPHSTGAVAGHDGQGPQPAPRHAGRFADMPLDTDPSYDEADVSDKPAQIRRLPRIDAAARARIDTRNRRRLESLLAVDEAIARLVAALRDAGELNRTLIVFTSDNGWQEGEHRVQQGKIRVYEPSIRVPLIVRGPGYAAGATAGAFAINTDLAATIAEAAGAAPGRTLDGLTLREVAAGSPRALARPLLNETGAPGRSDGAFHQAIRTAEHLYVEHSSGERELYDLRSDPYQLAGVHADPAQAGTIAALAARLAVLKTCAGETCVTGEAPPPPPPAAAPLPTVAGSESAERVLRLGRDRTLRLGRHGRVRVMLRCSSGAEDGCRGVLRLYAKVKPRPRARRTVLRKIGALRFALEAGTAKRLRVPIRARWRKRLARERALIVIARARYESLAGGRIGVERRYRLRPPLRRSGG
jgi:N-acetylglucosamine-6-sulfatase